MSQLVYNQGNACNLVTKQFQGFPQVCFKLLFTLAPDLLASTDLARAMLFGNPTIVLKLFTALFSFRLSQAASSVASVRDYFTYSHLSLPYSMFLGRCFIMKPH